MKKSLFYILAIFALVLLSCEKEPAPEPIRTTVLFYTSGMGYEIRMPPTVVRIIYWQYPPQCTDMPSESLKSPKMVPGVYDYDLYKTVGSGVEFLRSGQLTIVQGCNIFNLNNL